MEYDLLGAKAPLERVVGGSVCLSVSNTLACFSISLGLTFWFERILYLFLNKILVILHNPNKIINQYQFKLLRVSNISIIYCYSYFFYLKKITSYDQLLTGGYLRKQYLFFLVNFHFHFLSHSRFLFLGVMQEIIFPFLK